MWVFGRPGTNLSENKNSLPRYAQKSVPQNIFLFLSHQIIISSSRHCCFSRRTKLVKSQLRI